MAIATTLSDAIIDFLKDASFGAKAYRDGAPKGEALPYVTVTEGISLIPEGDSDGGVGESGTELVQVDLWQQWSDVNGTVTESPGLVNRLVRLLHSGDLLDTPQRVHGVSVVSKRRLFELNRNIVHDAITVAIARDL